MSSYSNRYSDEACQQITLDGEPCRSAALRGKKFCYYHLHSGPPPEQVSNLGVIPQVQFHLPLLDDAITIQSAITLVCEHLLHRRLEPKKAGMVLYALQVASSNLGRLNQDRNQQKNEQSNAANRLQASPPDPASSSATPVGQGDSGATPSHDPDRLPPGTIQACQQRPRRRSIV